MKQPAEPVDVGTFVVSLKGHDRGRVYLVLEIDPPFVFVADGIYRSANKMKKKRATHVRRWRTQLKPVQVDDIRSTAPAEQDRLIRGLIAEANAKIKREVTDA